VIAPILETPRLILRDHRVEDFAALAQMWADPTVTRYIGGRTSTSEESWTRLLRHVGHWTLLGFGYWAITEKASGHFIGQAGFADHKRISGSELKHLPEIGWALAPAAHGRSYASEAVSAITSWGDANLASDSTTCIIHPENAASIRIAEKLGYREFQRIEYKGDPTIVFIRHRP
jgi:RimJ/RimL family protein N-acetyltransferase